MVGGSADTDGFVGGVDIGFDAVGSVSGFADSDLLGYAGWTKKNAQDGEVEGAVCGGNGGWEPDKRRPSRSRVAAAVALSSSETHLR